MNGHWLKQTSEQPLFPDLLWAKPENKLHSGKLLIIGGSSSGFHVSVSIFSEAQNAGAGTVKVMLPDSVKKFVTQTSEDIIFAAANKSGGFAQTALSELINASDWADAVLIAGELGNNSETVVLLEKFFNKYSGPLIISEESFDFSRNFLSKLIGSDQTVFILDIAKLQKLFIESGAVKPITSNIGLVNLIEAIYDNVHNIKASYIIHFDDHLIVAAQDKISSTNLENTNYLSAKLAASAAVWYAQNPLKPFEALSCAVLT